jgi:hypothetical protein
MQETRDRRPVRKPVSACAEAVWHEGPAAGHPPRTPVPHSRRRPGRRQQLSPGAGGAIKEIRAGKFILEDAKGKVRAVLAMTEDAPGLLLSDENGKPRAMLDLTKDWPGLALFDEKGEHRGGRDGGQLRPGERAGQSADARAGDDGAPCRRVPGGLSQPLAAVMAARGQTTTGATGGWLPAFRHPDGDKPGAGQVWVLWAVADTGDAQVKAPVVRMDMVRQTA